MGHICWRSRILRIIICMVCCMVCKSLRKDTCEVADDVPLAQARTIHAIGVL